MVADSETDDAGKRVGIHRPCKFHPTERAAKAQKTRARYFSHCILSNWPIQYVHAYASKIDLGSSLVVLQVAEQSIILSSSHVVVIQE